MLGIDTAVMTATEIRFKQEQAKSDMLDAHRYAMEQMQQMVDHPPLIHPPLIKVAHTNQAFPVPNDVIEYTAFDEMKQAPFKAYQYTGRYVKSQIMDTLAMDLQTLGPNEARRLLAHFESSFPHLKAKLDKILGDGKI